MEEKVSVNDFSLFYALDRGVGQVVAALKKSGLYKNTVLIFSSDNGGNVRTVSNFPLRGEKGCLYEGGVRAVQFVHSPLLRESYKSNKLMIICHRLNLHVVSDGQVDLHQGLVLHHPQSGGVGVRCSHHHGLLQHVGLHSFSEGQISQEGNHPQH